MPEPTKQQKTQKTVSVYFKRKDSYIARSLEVLAVKEGITESDLLRECFKEYCISIKIYERGEAGNKDKWNSKKIEKLEGIYKKSKKGLSKDPVEE